jgi:phosphatidylglycerophosphate synthase
MTSRDGQHERTSRFLFSRLEKKILPRMAGALPSWVMPDHLTFLGMTASTAIGASYLMTNRSASWLWAVSAFLIVQWFGDSLDGTLARFRRIERPRYGFYLDHLTDAYSTVVVGIGLGLSPYMLLAVGLSIVIAYLVLSINVYLETHVFGEFSFGYGMLGPTEVRVVLIGLNTTAALVGPVPFTAFGLGMTVFDLGGMAAALGMLGLLLSRSVGNLRRLAELEPAGRKKGV